MPTEKKKAPELFHEALERRKQLKKPEIYSEHTPESLTKLKENLEMEINQRQEEHDDLKAQKIVGPELTMHLVAMTTLENLLQDLNKVRVEVLSEIDKQN